MSANRNLAIHALRPHLGTNREKADVGGSNLSQGTTLQWPIVVTIPILSATFGNMSQTKLPTANL